jgi:CDP-diacylglycerol--glycerol-3-phosphate 3-phosphatidyltransferase
MNRIDKIKFSFVQSLTLGRIPLVLIFLAVNLLVNTRQHPFWFNVALGAMILSAATDLFDGYFARRFKMTTRLGAYADPMTDKIFYLTTFPTLVYLAGREQQPFHVRLLLGLAILFLMRDQWVTFLRSIGALHQVDPRANWSGKARTIISFPVICVIYYDLQAPAAWWLQFPRGLVYGLEVISAAINAVSIWVYTLHYWPWVMKEMRITPPPTDRAE